MSRDTIFRSLGLEGLKSQSRLGSLKSQKMGVSRPHLKVLFKIEQSKPNFRQYCFAVKPTLILRFLTYTEKNSFT